MAIFFVDNVNDRYGERDVAPPAIAYILCAAGSIEYNIAKLQDDGSVSFLPDYVLIHEEQYREAREKITDKVLVRNVGRRP